MNVVADENVDRQIVEKLRNDRHAVWYVAETSPSITDDVVLQIANSQAALLLTSDKDFGELVFRQNLASHGVVLLRLSGMPPEIKAEVVSSTITAHENELSKNFTENPVFFIRLPVTIRFQGSVGRAINVTAEAFSQKAQDVVSPFS